MIDATCAPAGIAYPKDLQLLNHTHEKLEEMIDTLHLPFRGKAAQAAYLPKESTQSLFVSGQATESQTQNPAQGDRETTNFHPT